MTTDFDRSHLFRLIAGVLLAVLCLGFDAGTAAAGSSDAIVAVESVVAVQLAVVPTRARRRSRTLTEWRRLKRPTPARRGPMWHRRLQHLLPPRQHQLLPPARRGPPTLLR